jgi:hypothetical protein
MIMRWIFIVFFFQGVQVAAQQTAPVDTALFSLFDRLPKVGTSPDEIWKVYFPKAKTTPTMIFEKELQQQLNILEKESAGKSRLLAMLAGTYENRSSTKDYSKEKYDKDPQLDKALTECNSNFFGELDKYLRIVNAGIDSSFKHATTAGRAPSILGVYNNALPGFTSKVRKELMTLQALMMRKGYSKELAKGNAAFKYYVQLLEVRGLMLDRILQLNRQVASANNMIGELVDYCRKSPESCQ